MSNTNLTISTITKEALRILKNELGFAKNVNRQYDDQFAKSGGKIGQSINIRKPVRFSVSNGATLSNQDVTETQETLTLDSQKHIAFRFTSKELALDIDNFSERYIKPAVCALANKIDYDGLSLYQDVYQSVGTPGTTPNAFSMLTNAGTKLSNSGAPLDGRSICFNPAASGSMADSLKGLFQSQEQIKDQYEKGLMGLAGGFKIGMDQNVRQHTNATHSGTPLVNGAAQSGSSLITDGWASGAVSLTKGSVFTIAGVNAVNPQSRESTGQLQQFVVTTTIADTSGAATIAISPAMTATGAYKTIDSVPADNAAITVLGTTGLLYPQNLAFHKDAFVLGMADLDLPGGVDMAARASDPDSGLSVRIVRAYDISEDRMPCRIDVLYGWKSVYPELATRIWG